MRRGVLTGGLIALALGCSAPAASAVVTFGSTLPAPSAGYWDACSDACTAGLLEAPGATVASPAGGRIVRFRLRTDAGSDPQQIRFRVLRTTDGVTFTGAGTSPAFDLPTTAGIHEFRVDLPVAQGDRIGIDEPGGNKAAHVIASNPAAFQGGWFPALADGGPARESGNPKGPSTQYELLLQADVEPASTPPAPGPGPATPAPSISSCTDRSNVATCAAPGGPPSICGPTGLGFPQCNVPLNLPTACSGAGTGLPTCNLPGNYIVACGGFGLGLAVCNLPPLEVPQVCGPTTVGLPPCAASNMQVLACGPPTVGLPACNFKTLIKAPAPIDISSGALDFELSCPADAQATSAGARGARARASRSTTCEAEIDLAALVDAKVSALIGEGNGRCDFAYFGYILGGTTAEERERDRTVDSERERTLWANLVSCNYRARQLALDYLHSDLRSGYTGEAFARPTSADELRIRKVLQSQYPNYPRTTAGPYQGPPGLWQNEETLRQTRLIATSIIAAVNEVYALQDRASRRGAKASAALPAVPRAPAARMKPLLRTRVKVQVGTRATRIHVRLPRSTVRALRKRASRRNRTVAVRVAVSFKARPRPIVRFTDLRLRLR
jgi:hypothetical protein